MKIIKEFLEFIKEYKVLGLAIAFIIGGAATALVTAIVNDIIMPVATFFIPGGEWKAATFTLGSIVIKWGEFLGALINFLIIAFFIFMIVRFIPKGKKEEKTEEKKVTKKEVKK
jgi:large conductance mechanosensitive channel